MQPQFFQLFCICWETPLPCPQKHGFFCSKTSEGHRKKQASANTCLLVCFELSVLNIQAAPVVSPSPGSSGGASSWQLSALTDSQAIMALGWASAVLTKTMAAVDLCQAFTSRVEKLLQRIIFLTILLFPCRTMFHTNRFYL